MPAAENNSGLFVKSYFTHSIAEALEQAQVELGPDALLLNTRPAPPEAGHLGEYEVVFGCPPVAAGSKAGLDPVDDLRKQMEQIREMVTRIGSPSQPARSNTVADVLVNAGIAPRLAAEIDLAVQQRLRNRSALQTG